MGLFPIEIKSAATFSPTFLKGFDPVRSAVTARLGRGTVLSNGKQRFRVNDVEIFNPLTEPDLWPAATAPPS